MKSVKFILFLALLLFSASSMADSQRLISNTLFKFELPSNRWQVSAEPPALAIDAMYADLVFGKNQKGEDFDPEKLRQMATKFVQINNLYIYNEESEAYLMISISPFDEKNGPPKKKHIKNSAKWAVDAILEHADVSDLSSFTSSTSFIEIPGMNYAARIDADYPMFGEPHHFIGIIGYAHPYWVFMYYNDKLEDSYDLKEMKKIISSIKFDLMK